MTTPKYTVYQDAEQWLPFFTWFWAAAGEPQDLRHGAYPARWIARLSGWLHTR